jgi:hypothetical protein
MAASKARPAGGGDQAGPGPAGRRQDHQGEDRQAQPREDVPIPETRV